MHKNPRKTTFHRDHSLSIEALPNQEPVWGDLFYTESPRDSSSLIVVSLPRRKEKKKGDSRQKKHSPIVTKSSLEKVASTQREFWPVWPGWKNRKRWEILDWTDHFWAASRGGRPCLLWTIDSDEIIISWAGRQALNLVRLRTSCLYVEFCEEKKYIYSTSRMTISTVALINTVKTPLTTGNDDSQRCFLSTR